MCVVHCNMSCLQMFTQPSCAKEKVQSVLTRDDLLLPNQITRFLQNDEDCKAEKLPDFFFRNDKHLETVKKKITYHENIPSM